MTDRKLRLFTAVAALGGAVVAACNLTLGLGGYDFDWAGAAPGAGGKPAWGHVVAATRGVWSKSFGGAGDQTVAAVAVDGAGHVFLTGRGNGAAGLGCALPATTTMDSGAGYLVELDGQGVCQWALLFGDEAAGTGVAVDRTTGTIALTGTFTKSTTIKPAWPMLPAGTDAFVAVFGRDHALRWVRHVGDGSTQGDQKTTAVALAGGQVAVAGYYDGSLRVTSPPADPNGTLVIDDTSDAQDAFVLWFDENGALGQGNVLEIASDGTKLDQRAEGVALDSNGAFAVAGTTSGATSFNGEAAVPASGDPSIFVAAYTLGKTARFHAILGDGRYQQGRCVAFDEAGDVFLGGEFLGSVELPGQGGDGGVTLANEGGTDVLVARFAGTDGSSVGAMQFGADSHGDDATIGGLAPHDGVLVFAGGFSGKAHFRDGTSVTAAGGKDVYVATVDAALSKVLWIERYGDDTGDQVADAVAVGQDGTIVVAGHFKGGLDFGGKASPLVGSPGAGSDVFVVKLAR